MLLTKIAPSASRKALRPFRFPHASPRDQRTRQHNRQGCTRGSKTVQNRITWITLTTRQDTHENAHRGHPDWIQQSRNSVESDVIQQDLISGSRRFRNTQLLQHEKG